MKKEDLLLLMIALSGEFPSYLAGRVVGSESYAAALVTGMKQKGYISVRSKDGLKGYTLKAKAKKYLLSKYEKEVSFFLLESTAGHVKSEPGKRLRLHRMSKAWVFFWETGIPIFGTGRPALFGRHPGKGEGERAAYYGSLEFKGSSEAIKGSRACGMLLSGESVYIVYHTMAQRMKWAKKMERSIRVWAEKQCMRCQSMQAVHAVMIGDTMEFLLDLLESDGGIKKNLFQVDDTFERYYYLPMSPRARLQVELLVSHQKRDALCRFLCSALKGVETGPALYAGLGEDGNPVYFCYELEMRELLRIKQQLDFGKGGTIWCFDYQTSTLERYFGGGADYHALSAEKVMQYLSKL